MAAVSSFPVTPGAEVGQRASLPWRSTARHSPFTIHVSRTTGEFCQLKLLARRGSTAARSTM